MTEEQLAEYIHLQEEMCRLSATLASLKSRLKEIEKASSFDVFEGTFVFSVGDIKYLIVVDEHELASVDRLDDINDLFSKTKSGQEETILIE